MNTVNLGLPKKRGINAAKIILAVGDDRLAVGIPARIFDLAGLELKLSISDPDQTTQSQHDESLSIADDIWSSKHKHLEDE